MPDVPKKQSYTHRDGVEEVEEAFCGCGFVGVVQTRKFHDSEDDADLEICKYDVALSLVHVREFEDSLFK